jgi:PAS domain-containing protein
MTGSRRDLDYAAVFRALPVPAIIMTPDLVVADVNDAFIAVFGRDRDWLIGEPVLAAFPRNPADPAATGPANLTDSVRRAVQTGESDAMPLQRYDVEDAGSPGTYRERYWCPVNAPVRGPDGAVTMIVHVVEEIPDLIRKFVDAEAASS